MLITGQNLVTELDLVALDLDNGGRSPVWPTKLDYNGQVLVVRFGYLNSASFCICSTCYTLLPENFSPL